MKIALCLSGQIRSFPLVKQSLIENILENNDVDIFCHSWYKYDNSKYQNFWNYDPTDFGGYSMDDIIDVLNTLKPKSFRFDHPSIDVPTRSMFYSIRESNRMKVDYELLNNFKYDVCIRARYDLKYNQRISFDISNGGINLINRSGGCGGLNDWFAYGSSELMDIYSNIFDEYDQTERINQMCPEGIISEHLSHHNIGNNSIPRTFDLVRSDGRIVL
jgi:hypothetical protein